MGNPRRLKTIKALHRKNEIDGKLCPELMIIDARAKKAASTFQKDEILQDFDLEDIEFDFGDMQDIDIDLSDMQDIKI